LPIGITPKTRSIFKHPTPINGRRRTNDTSKSHTTKNIQRTATTMLGVTTEYDPWKKTAGSISHVLIPIPPNPNIPNEDTQYKRIQTKPEMDFTLLTQNINHFAQADGSPFTQQPLLDIIGDDGCALGALQILEGNIPNNLDVTKNYY
jgi:hypothetical protein